MFLLSEVSRRGRCEVLRGSSRPDGAFEALSGAVAHSGQTIVETRVRVDYNIHMNSEQHEAYAVDLLKSYTPDVYVGPDIREESMRQMVDPDHEGMVYLEPVHNTTKRVIVTLLKSADHLTDISRDLIPCCFAIGNCISNPKTRLVAVKWYNLAGE